jgi:hypothetical protein
VEVLEQHGEASVEVRNRCKDGTPIWTQAHVAGFEHPDHGKVWVSVQQEIPDRKEAAYELSDRTAPAGNGGRFARFVRP